MSTRPFKLAPRMVSLALAFSAPAAAATLQAPVSGAHGGQPSRAGFDARPTVMPAPTNEHGPAGAGPRRSSKPPRGLEPRT